MQTAIIGGPAFGGILYAIGPIYTYMAAFTLFLVSVTAAFNIKIKAAAPKKEPISLASLFAGVHFIFQRPILLGAISLDLFAVLLGGATALLPVYARDILHTGPQGLGLLRSATAMGALLMTIILGYRPVERKVGHKLLAAVAVFGVATLLFGYSTNFVLSFIAIVVAGAADMISVVVRQTLVQLEVPDEMRGRVSAVNSVFIGASNELGEFESGSTAALLGPVNSVALGGIGTLLVVAIWWRIFPGLRDRDRLVIEKS